MAFLMNLMYRPTTRGRRGATAGTRRAATAAHGDAAHVPAVPRRWAAVVPLLVYTATGGKIVLMYKWDAVEAVDLIERENVTAVAGVPTTMFQLLEVAKAQGRELALALGRGVGRDARPARARAPHRRRSSRRGPRPTNGYGLTETSGAAIANVGKDYVDRPDSVGTLISPVIEVKIVDADGNEAPRRRGRRDLAEGADGRAGLLQQPRGDRRLIPRRMVRSPATSAASTTRATSTSSTG